MSTIEEFTGDEHRVRELLEKLRQASAADPENICRQIEQATSAYKRVVRELKAEQSDLRANES